MTREEEREMEQEVKVSINKKRANNTILCRVLLFIEKMKQMACSSEGDGVQ